MKNERLFINKKKRTKWWISLAVIFTILVGASLGTLSMYNWSVNQAIQGLFYNTKQPVNVADDTGEENPSDNNEEDPTSETPDPSEDELDDVTPPTYGEGEKTPETIEEPTFVEDVLISNKQYPLPATYAPGESEEAQEAFQAMKAAGAAEGLDLVAFSR